MLLIKQSEEIRSAASDLVLHCLSVSHKKKARFKWFNPFMPNGIYHYYLLDQSLSVSRVVGSIFFSFLFKF